jgi:hypothetical protein
MCNIPVFGVTKIEETDVCMAFMHGKSGEFSRFKVKQSQQLKFHLTLMELK